MSGTQLVCDLCNKEIRFGAGYVSINYNIENLDKDPITLETYVDVISSEQVVTICAKCGNKRSATKVAEILRTTLKTQEPRLN
jgi:uncharacterized protein YneF (UPF0154 family)